MEHIDLIGRFLAHYGYFAIFGLLMLGIVGPLIPDETILVLSGIAVHSGQLRPGPTIAIAFAGSLCGITLSYTLGRTGVIYVLERFEPLHRWVGRHLPQVEGWFQRYGKWTLFFGYFILGVRHFTALAAGMSKVRLRTFMLYAYPGGFAWVVCFVSIGYYLGAEWERLSRRFNRGALIVAAIVVLVSLAGWYLRRKNPVA
ncbi:MAG TPA: DedA family protein [Bryobacteraceae bacterium]|nr:DedA family protein [Bryobacteraceae bacterium]